MWIIQASASALFESWHNAMTRSTRDRWTVTAAAWWQRLVAALSLAVLALAWRGWPAAPPLAAWLPAVGSIVINAGVTLLYLRALRTGELSATAPITALSPVLLLGTEPLMTGHGVPPLGMLGALVIAFGLYVLNLPTLKESGPLGPFRAVWREPGPRMMLMVVLAWSVTAPLDRLSVRAWDPIWYAASLHGGIAILIAPLWLRARRPDDAPPWRLGLLGLASGAASACQMAAMTVAPATYVVALRRFSAPLGVVWGKIWFQEPHFAERLLGALVMTAGAVLIILSL